MAERIFLIVSSVSIMAMRRRGGLQRGQIVSISNVFLRSWLQEMQCESGSEGLSFSSGVGTTGTGTIWLRRLECDDSTPK
jgi:hypothetical protein